MISVLQENSPASSFLSVEQQPSQSGGLAQAVLEKFKSLLAFITTLKDKLKEFKGFAVESREIKQTLEKLYTGLSTIDLHFSFLAKVIEHEKREKVVEKLKVKFEFISGSYESLINPSDIKLVPVNDVLNNVVTNLFQDIQKLLEGLLVDKKGEKRVKNSKERISQAQILTAKLESVLEYFPGLATMGEGEIFTYPKSSPIWKKLYSVTRVEYLQDKKAIEKSIKLFCKMVILANAVAYKSQEVEKKVKNGTLAKIVGFLSGAYYSVANEKAQTRAELLFANPTMETAFKVWNLPDHGFVKEMFKLTLPAIEYDNKIYVSRLFPEITKESILQEYERGDQNKITPRDFIAPNLLEQKEEILKTIFDKNPEKVKIRIIAPFPLIIRGTPTEKMKAKISEIKGIFPKDPSENTFKEDFKGVVIHIHGGGFVSMSSSAHRNYLIRWAKSLNMVIFSIDYRLAPAHPYPAALDDVWQAYNWLINYSEPILGIPMERIVVTGDSAGGNLAAALTLRAIKEGIRVPEGCMLSYPALSLYPKKVIPSYFVAINNNILPYNILKLCLKAYIPEDLKPESDPFLSPLVASDELLAKMPAVRLVTGTDDPLHDDNWQFLDRLQKLDKDVQMTVYEGVPHGFLSLDDLVDYELVIAETIGRLRELFHSVGKKIK